MKVIVRAEVKFPPLCDRCGHPADVAVMRKGVRLEFCGEHFKQNENVLRLRGWFTVRDKRKVR